MSKDANLDREKVAKLFETITPKAIPVDIKMEGQNKILSYSEAEKVLQNTRVIVLTECSCRKQRQFCDKPLEVCLAFDEYGESYLKKDQGKIISFDHTSGNSSLSNTCWSTFHKYSVTYI